MNEVDNKFQGGNAAANVDEQFDIVWLIKYVFAHRRFVCWGVGLAVAFAVCLYIFKPKQFKVSASVLPVSEDNNSDLGQLAGLASMAGVNMKMGGGSLITPDLYSDVVMSTPSKLKLMRIPIHWVEPHDTIMSLYDHVLADSIHGFGYYLMRYTIELPMTIKQALSSKQTKRLVTVPDGDGDASKPIVIDEKIFSCFEWIEKAISVSVDSETGLVTVDVFGESPKQCSMMAVAVVEHMQNMIVQFKTKSARQALVAIEKRYSETLQEYEKLRADYFLYRDRHRDFVEERTSVERQKLEDSYNLSYNLLTTLQKQMESSRLEVLNSTPAFSVVEPVVEPLKKDSPKLLLHLIGGFFLGFIFTVGWLIVRVSYWQVFDVEKFREVYDEFASN